MLQRAWRYQMTEDKPIYKVARKETPPACYTCELFYRKTDETFDGCPWISSNKINSPECRQAYVRYNALSRIRSVHHKWFKYKDETLLDICLATKIHSLQLGSKYHNALWLFLIGVSGDRKSSTVESFIDDPLNGEESSTYFMNYITPNTLATGFAKNVDKDLAPKLNNKLVITGDFAQFLKMPIETKGAVWSQFREAYDGRVQKKTGSGVETLYVDNFWDWLVCSTPAIDEELLMKDALGTRELMYRLPEENTDEKSKQELMEAVWNNVEVKEERKAELKQAAQEMVDWYQKNRQYLQPIIIDNIVKKKLFQYADFITQLRASAECDWKTGELTNFVYPEKPTRILEQLKMLFTCLKQLDYDYSNEEALLRILEIVKSSIHPVRLKILLTVKQEHQLLSTTEISRKVGLAYVTTNRELQICRQLGILIKLEDRIKGADAFLWSVNLEHPIIEVLKEFAIKQSDIYGAISSQLSVEDKPSSDVELMTFIDSQVVTAQ